MVGKWGGKTNPSWSGAMVDNNRSGVHRYVTGAMWFCQAVRHSVLTTEPGKEKKT